ncbi:MAG: hypothetical protein L3J71_14060 [Victivallaceae bacterium]|nr:hypothetical protein [Victivallaceae bacterium]
MAQFIINHRGSNVLTIRESRWDNILILCVIIFFFSTWYYFLLQQPSSFSDIINAIEKLSTAGFKMWLGFLLPLLATPNIFYIVKTIVVGNIFTFDKDIGIILKNGKQQAVFADVDSLKIRKISESDDHTEYRLSLVLKDKNKILVGQGGSFNNICGMADDIADILNVQIVNKS